MIAAVSILLIRIAMILIQNESFEKSIIGRTSILLLYLALWYLLRMRYLKYTPLLVTLAPIIAISMELSNSVYFESNDGSEDQRDVMFEMMVYYTVLN